MSSFSENVLSTIFEITNRTGGSIWPQGEDRRRSLGNVRSLKRLPIVIRPFKNQKLTNSSLLGGKTEPFVGKDGHNQENNESYAKENTHIKSYTYPFTLPTSSTRILPKANFIVCYDQAKRIPCWEFETLTRDSITGKAKRSSKFRGDACIPALFRSTKRDYKKSGFDRGHLAPAGNNKQNSKVMEQTFLLSNIVPQNHQMNAGIWSELEFFCRNLTMDWDAVHVITGHVMRPQTMTDSKGNEIKVVSYQVIGPNEVAVPTHLYKIILCERGRQRPNEHDGVNQKQKRNAILDLTKTLDQIANPRARSPNNSFIPVMGGHSDKVWKNWNFLIPNSEIEADQQIEDYAISLREIVKFSGFEFFGGWGGKKRRI